MDTIIDPINGARCSQAMVPMRDGTRLNTFMFLPADNGPRFPVILHRTPYGIAASDAAQVWVVPSELTVTSFVIGRCETKDNTHWDTTGGTDLQGVGRPSESWPTRQTSRALDSPA